MKKLFLLLALALTVYGTAMADDTPASNEIWYTSMNKTQVTPYVTNAFGATIQSNVYDTEADRGVISFDGTVTNIGDRAFYRCDELVFVKYPTTVKSIGAYAFNGCTKLSSIDLQEGVTSIGARAFDGCAGMEELTIPSTVTSIGNWAFDGCQSLNKVYMSSEVLSDVSKDIFTKNVVIIVPAKLYEAYKSYFKDINKVEVPTEEWQDYTLSQIEAAMQTIKMISDTDKNTIASYISTIENAMTFDDMATAYYAALTLIDQKKTIEENLKDLLGSMGRMQSGPAIEIVGNDGRVILIYDIKKVKYIMVNKEE